MTPEPRGCDNGAMANALTSLAFIGFLSALVWWARGRQPQWVSRDGSRFITYACPVDSTSNSSRWTRVHGRIHHGRIALRQSFLATSRLSGEYSVIAREHDDRFVVYTLGPDELVWLRTRIDDPLVPVLDDMLP